MTAAEVLSPCAETLPTLQCTSGCGAGAQEKRRGLVDRHFLAEVTVAMSDRCHVVLDGAGLRAHGTDSLPEDSALHWRMA